MWRENNFLIHGRCEITNGIFVLEQYGCLSVFDLRIKWSLHFSFIRKTSLTVSLIRSFIVCSLSSPSPCLTRSNPDTFALKAGTLRYFRESDISDVFWAIDCRALLALDHSHCVIEVNKYRTKSYFRLGFSLSRCAGMDLLLLCSLLLALRVGLILRSLFVDSLDSRAESFIVSVSIIELLL